MIGADNIVVLSVYGKESARWFPLQQQFLAAFPHELAVFLNGCPETVVPGAKIIGSDQSPAKQQVQHLRGLDALLAYARARGKACLVLDCDAWPIAADWRTRLTRLMGGSKAAAIYRYENMDCFPHPAVVFVRDPLAITFELKETTNLVGQKFQEIQVVSDAQIFPLLRSNRLNRHYLAGGVYGSLFYHHCCGSRPWGVRSGAFLGDDQVARDELTADLFSDPIRTISELTGSIQAPTRP